MLVLAPPLGIQKTTGLYRLDYSGWSDFLPSHPLSSLPTTSAKLQLPGKMIRHLLSHLQQVDILKIPDKVVSTALMAAAVAVRSSGLIFIVGDETQRLLVPQVSLEPRLGCWGLPHFSPRKGKPQNTDTRQDTNGQTQTHPRTSH